MALDLEEQEQIDQLRAWWSKYGNLLMAILIVALSLMAAWRGWQWYQVHQAGQARGYFEALQDAASQQTGEESVARITAAVKTLRDDYANTEYATRGALIAATALEARKDTAGARAARMGDPVRRSCAGSRGKVALGWTPLEQERFRRCTCCAQ